MTGKFKPTTLTKRDTNEFKPAMRFPDDVREEFAPTRYGPCDVANRYGVLPSNQLGDLQLHPCTWCKGVFVFSPLYGWVEIKQGSPMKERARELIRDAVEAGVFPRGSILKSDQR